MSDAATGRAPERLPAGPPERPGRHERSFGGMIGALLVLLVGVGAFVLLRDANRLEPASQVQAVDYVRPAQVAQEEADFEVLTPRALPDGWIATSVGFEDGDGGADGDGAVQSWHVGWLTAEQRYIGLEQAQRPVTAMVEDFVDEDAREGVEVVVEDRTWTTWTDPERDPEADPGTAPDGDLALVREDGEVTTLVVGTLSQDELTAFAASLR